MQKRCYARESWQAKHKRTVANNALLLRSRTDAMLAEYNAKGPGCAFRIPDSLHGNTCAILSCSTCTFVCQKASDMINHGCLGQAGRHYHMTHRKRKAWWHRHRANSPELIGFLVPKWKVTMSDLKHLEADLSSGGGRRGVLPAQQCSWYKDVTQDGDVHPNPGPSCCQVAMLNCGGSTGAWAFARFIAQTRPAVALVQEHALLPERQADMSKFLKHEGYRSWFAARGAQNNVHGKEYTIGGAAVWVRQDKPAREIRRFQTINGQAIMIELDNLYIICTYIPPHSQEEIAVALSTLDEWITPMGTLQPILLAGDFNHPPALAERWDAVAGRGASFGVKNENGIWLPTRWTGSRPIDWGWCSHPHMVKNIAFRDICISDHKVLSWELHYNQKSVQAFRSVPTRSFALPESVHRSVWRQAVEKAWDHKTVPAPSTTEDEWAKFCQMVEEAFCQACEDCNMDMPSPARFRGKGSHMQVHQRCSETFRLKQVASCRELKLRKLLGRTREALMQIHQGHDIPRPLSRRIWSHPLVRHAQFPSIETIHTWAEQELLSTVRESQNARLQKWRHEMRTDVKLAGKWVKKDMAMPVTSVFEPSFRAGAASQSNQESLQTIHAFWKQIWDRERPHPDEAFQFWQQGLAPGAPLQWEPLTAEELHRQATRQKGAAGGCDGFCGDDIADLPLAAWHIFAELFARWQGRAEVPEIWKSIKQVHLQKPDTKPREADAAFAAKDLRPISIQCVLWRTIASAWCRRPATRTWVLSWVHNTAFGGIQGRSVAQAIDVLFENFEQNGKILVSLDYQKCFDCVDPSFGIQCLRHFGCPQPILRLVQSIWQQERWLTYNGEFLPYSIPVHSSLPQGDALSPPTLIAIITGLASKVVQVDPRHTLVTFLDDRNFIANSPQQAAHLWHEWNAVSARVGLRENESRIKIVSRKASFRHPLLEAGFSDQHLVDAARVLGVDFSARLGSKAGKTQDSRIKAAAHRVARIALMPVSVDRKAGLIASLAIPKAAWGAWIAVKPLAKLLHPVKQTAGGLHRCASNPLFYLLSGHGLDAQFCAGMQAFSTLARVVRERPRPWPRQIKKGTWLGAVQGFLQSLGWQGHGPWKWRHVDFPRISIDLSCRISRDDVSKEEHVVRESWRRVQFSRFINSGRRDAQAVGEQAYSESRMTRVRKIFKDQNTHGRGVMIGAICSDARFDRIRGLDIQGCVWCDSDEIPSWEHLAWFCRGFRQSRCHVPRDTLQYVLGWPTGRSKDYDNAVLAHLAGVRARMLERRYRPQNVA
jgi:hypothetical protein